MKILCILLLLFTYSNAQVDNKSNKLQDELNTILEDDQKYRVILTSDTILSEKQIDSLWELQYDLDNINIDKSIDIIKKFGYINSLNSDFITPFMTVFMHTPKKRIEEVKKIINIEKDKGTIDKASYGMIMWHLHGRKNEFQINRNGTDNK